MYQKRNHKRNGKMKKRIEKRNQEEEEEEREEEEKEEIRRGLSNKGMCVVALFKTHLSPFTDYSFTVYRWKEDGR